MFLKNLKEYKKQLRAKHKKLRVNCPPEIKTELDNKLTADFLNTDEYKQCETLFAFASSEIEVNTADIIQRAFCDGKRLVLPKCKDRRGEMDFYYITSTNQLEKGAFSIMEPVVDKCEQVKDFSSGLCIVPGLCFDMQGYRIGFGKGYYDRFLQKFKGVTVGLCYSKCTEHELPKGVFDRPVDILITEKYINYTQGNQ